MTQDPRIEALKASGIPECAYLQEDLYAQFKLIGADAAHEAIKIVHGCVLKMGGDLSAADIESLAESIAEAIAEDLVHRNICDHSRLPLTQNEHDESAMHVEYEENDA